MIAEGFSISAIAGLGGGTRGSAAHAVVAKFRFVDARKEIIFHSGAHSAAHDAGFGAGPTAQDAGGLPISTAVCTPNLLLPVADATANVLPSKAGGANKATG